MKDRNTNVKTKEFLELKTSEVKEVYNLYLDCVAQQFTSEQTVEALSKFMSTEYNFSSLLADSIATRIYNNLVSAEFQETLIDATVNEAIAAEIEHAKPHITITLEDYKKFTEMVQIDPEITEPIKRLLFSFIVFYRYNFHSSFWIRYNKKNIFYLAGAHKFSTQQQEKMTNYLHTHYGLNMRVIGSTQPIVCYNMYWLQEQPTPGGIDNPFITLGELTPSDLAAIVKKIK